MQVTKYNDVSKHTHEQSNRGCLHNLEPGATHRSLRVNFPLSRYNLKTTKSTVTVLCTTFFSVVKVSATRHTL